MLWCVIKNWRRLNAMEDTRPTLHYFIISDVIETTKSCAVVIPCSIYPSAHKVRHKYNFISNIGGLDVSKMRPWFNF